MGAEPGSIRGVSLEQVPTARQTRSASNRPGERKDNMKRTLLLAAAGLLLILVSASTASAFGTKDVLRMTKDGVPDSLIIQKIEYSGKTFHLDAEDMHVLRDGGVSDGVISAMLRTEAPDGRDDGYGYGDGGYYYPSPYPYGHVSLGFGFYNYGGYRYYGHHSYYGSPYYGGYGYPRSHSHYGTPYSGNYGNQRYRGSYGTSPHSSGGSGSGTRTRTR
jgi:hypothetical protein